MSLPSRVAVQVGVISPNGQSHRYGKKANSIASLDTNRMLLSSKEISARIVLSQLSLLSANFGGTRTCHSTRNVTESKVA
jgi:hypothetical protein